MPSAPVKSPTFLSPSKRNKLLLDFQKSVEATIGRDLAFAFICGSFASKPKGEIHDLDVFVCVHRKVGRHISAFRKWYFAIHKKYNLQPDQEYPGEVMTTHALHSTLEVVLKTEPNFTIRRERLYDGVVWAGMLSGKRKSLIGNKSEYEDARLKADKVVSIWARRLLSGVKNMRSDLFLKHFTRFEPSKYVQH